MRRVPKRRAGIESRQYMGGFIVWKRATRARQAYRFERGLALLWALIDGERTAKEIAVVMSTSRRAKVTEGDVEKHLQKLANEKLIHYRGERT